MSSGCDTSCHRLKSVSLRDRPSREELDLELEQACHESGYILGSPDFHWPSPAFLMVTLQEGC